MNKADTPAGPPVTLAHRARGLVSWNWRGWNLEAGIRSGLACCAPLLLAEWLATPGLSWTAIIAFWTCLVDPGGPSHTRVRTIGGFACGAILGCFLAVIVQPYLWLSAAFAMIWCFAAVFARVWGDAAASAGTLLSIAVLVALGQDQPSSITAALDFAGLTLAGAVWAMLLTLVIWRQHPYAPARAAVAAVFREAAAYARALADLRLGQARNADPDRISARRRAAARDAIEAARATLIATRRGHAGPSIRDRHLVLMLADADRAFGTLIALDEVLDGMADHPVAGQQALRVGLTGLAGNMGMLADRLTGRTSRATSALGETVSIPNGHAAALLQQAVTWVSAAAGHLTRASPGEPLPEGILQDSDANLFDQLRNNLALDSLSLRHAARFAVTGACLVLVTNGLHLERGYWITLTAVAVLQVYPSATWQRVLERVGGSILGGVIAAGAAYVLRGPGEMILFVMPMSVLTMAVRGVSYALFVLCLTPVFVLVVELFQTGGLLSPALSHLRVIDSVVGSFAGLLANFTLWPSWEGRFLRERLTEDVRCNGEFLIAALDCRLGQECFEDVEQKRRAAGLASNNAEASLQRVLSEPRPQRELDIGAAMTVTAASRRLTGAAASLTQHGPEVKTNVDLGACRQWFQVEVDQIVTAMQAGSVPAGGKELMLPPTEGDVIATGVQRAWRQVSLLRDAAARLAGTCGKP